MPPGSDVRLRLTEFHFTGMKTNLDAVQPAGEQTAATFHQR